jgi:hypothetical protein
MPFPALLEPACAGDRAAMLAQMRENAARCRRLAMTAHDPRTILDLGELARDYDAMADALEADLHAP